MVLPGYVVWCFRLGGGVVGKLRCVPEVGMDWRMAYELMDVDAVVVDGELGGDGEGDIVLGFSGEIV